MWPPKVQRSGTSTCGTRIASMEAGDSTSDGPSSRCNRPKASRSVARPCRSPAGPAARGSPHCGATTGPLAPGGTRWPVAAPHSSASSGRVPAAASRVEVLSEGLVPGRTAQDLHQPAEQDESRVAVAHRRAERVHLLEPGHALDVPRQAVVAAPEVGEVVAVDAAGVASRCRAVTAAVRDGEATLKSRR